MQDSNNSLQEVSRLMREAISNLQRAIAISGAEPQAPATLAEARTFSGFRRLDFVDRNGAPCSLQESAADSCVWLGRNDIGLKVLGDGRGWEEIPIAALLPGRDVSANTRMHLTRYQVSVLLPFLQAFVETGALPPLDAGR